jgi:hypothetical protein
LTIAEVVSLRRARKAKARAEAATQAEANRIKHSVSKRERDIVKAHEAKARRDLTARKLDER